MQQLRGQFERQQYAEFLKSHWWDDFITVTFRKPRKEPYYAMQAVYHACERNNVRRGFLGCEPHQSGDLHIHGLIAGSGGTWKPSLSLPWEIYDNLFKAFGRSRVEACDNMEAVSNYCAKYILKQQNRVTDYYDFFGDAFWWRTSVLDKNVII